MRKRRNGVVVARLYDDIKEDFAMLCEEYGKSMSQKTSELIMEWVRREMRLKGSGAANRRGAT